MRAKLSDPGPSEADIEEEDLSIDMENPWLIRDVGSLGRVDEKVKVKLKAKKGQQKTAVRDESPAERGESRVERFRLR
jgi:hypothetical protein